MRKIKQAPAAFRRTDLAAWNFVIFLTLAFILMVVVLNLIGGMSLSLRSRAGLSCPDVQLPKAEDRCPGGAKWVFERVNGCPTFRCEAK